MLDRAHRLTSPALFRRVTRRGRKAQTNSVVCYLEPTDTQPRIGFVVAKTVGNAVTRNLVKRRLRTIARIHLDSITGDLVVRALPASSSVSAHQLEADFLFAVAKAGDPR